MIFLIYITSHPLLHLYVIYSILHILCTSNSSRQCAYMIPFILITTLLWKVGQADSQRLAQGNPCFIGEQGFEPMSSCLKSATPHWLYYTHWHITACPYPHLMGSPFLTHTGMGRPAGLPCILMGLGLAAAQSRVRGISYPLLHSSHPNRATRIPIGLLGSVPASADPSGLGKAYVCQANPPSSTPCISLPWPSLPGRSRNWYGEPAQTVTPQQVQMFVMAHLRHIWASTTDLCQPRVFRLILQVKIQVQCHLF